MTAKSVLGVQVVSQSKAVSKKDVAHIAEACNIQLRDHVLTILDVAAHLMSQCPQDAPSETLAVRLFTVGESCAQPQMNGLALIGDRAVQ